MTVFEVVRFLCLQSSVSSTLNIWLSVIERRASHLTEQVHIFWKLLGRVLGWDDGVWSSTLFFYLYLQSSVSSTLNIWLSVIERRASYLTEQVHIFWKLLGRVLGWDDGVWSSTLFFYLYLQSSVSSTLNIWLSVIERRASYLTEQVHIFWKLLGRVLGWDDGVWSSTLFFYLYLQSSVSSTLNIWLSVIERRASYLTEQVHIFWKLLGRVLGWDDGVWSSTLFFFCICSPRCHLRSTLGSPSSSGGPHTLLNRYIYSERLGEC